MNSHSSKGDSIILRNVLLVYLARFLTLLTYSSMRWYLPILIAERLGIVELGFIYGITNLPSLFMFAGGVIADTIGVKIFTIIIPLITSISLSPLYFATEWISLLLSLFSINMLNLEGPALMSLLIRSVGERHLGKFIALSRMVILFTVAIAPLFSSLVLSFTSLQGFLIIHIAILMIIIALRLFLVEGKEQFKDNRNTLSIIVERLQENFSYIPVSFKKYSTLVVLNSLSFITMSLIEPYVRYYFVDELKIDLTFIGLLSTVGNILQIVSQPICGLIIDRYGVRATLIIDFSTKCLIIASFTVLIPINKFLAVTIYNIQSIANFASSAYITYIGRKLPKERIALFTSSLGSLTSFLALFIPIITSYIWRVNLSYSLLLCILGYLFLIVLSLRLKD